MKKSSSRVFLLFGASALSVTLASCSFFTEQKKEEPAKPEVKKEAPVKKAEPAKPAPVKKVEAAKPEVKKEASAKKEVKPYEILLSTDKSGGVCKTGDTVTFTIQFFKDGKPVAGQKMGYYLYTDDGKKQMELFTTKEEPAKFQTKLTAPGSLRIEAAALSPDGKVMKMEVDKKSYNLQSQIGVIADPGTFKPGFTEPADFQKFWDDAKAELAKIPLDPKLEKVELPKTQQGAFQCWDVKVGSIGGTPVSGYLVMPAGAKSRSLPVIVTFHGAGVRSANKSFNPKAITFDVNAHGIANGQSPEFYANLSKKELSVYWRINAGSREQFYFRNMFLRVQRALDFVKSIPEWDGKNLIVSGSSQGGAQSIVAAGMDPQVTLMFASVPALCDHGGILAGRESGWPRLIALKDGKPADENIVKTTPYFDCAFFAKRIKADAYFTVGLVDRTCVPTSVYATFNSIPGKKNITVYPDKGHVGLSSSGFETALKQILDGVK